MHGAQGTQVEVHQEGLAPAKEGDYGGVLQRRYLRSQLGQLHHPEEAALRRRREDQGVSIGLFRLFLKLMEMMTVDPFGLRYLAQSKKLIENLLGIFNV